MTTHLTLKANATSFIEYPSHNRCLSTPSRIKYILKHTKFVRFELLTMVLMNALTLLTERKLVATSGMRTTCFIVLTLPIQP